MRIFTFAAALVITCALGLQAQSPADPPSGFNSLGFGIALAFRLNVTKPDLVNDASIDPNGIVRVDTRSNGHASLMLESHYLFFRYPRTGTPTWGMGPFVAVEPGTDQVINSIGAGWMVNWKVDGNGKGFGLGLGYASIPAARILGEGFIDGQPAPVDKNGNPLPITFQTRDKGSILGGFVVHVLE